jgi:hypothetical protein
MEETQAASEGCIKLHQGTVSQSDSYVQFEILCAARAAMRANRQKLKRDEAEQSRSSQRAHNRAAKV